MFKSFLRISLRYNKNISLLKYRQTLALTAAFSNPPLTYQPSYTFAKISKKQKQKQKADEEKKKIKQQLGDTSNFDLNPFEDRYKEILDSYKQTISHFKVGRLDPYLFSQIYVKIGNNNMSLPEVAEVAPKNANTVILNPFDHDNIDAIQKGVQITDLGFQVSRSDKTIIVTQPPNSMKELKEKMLIKLKKATEIQKEKFNKVRVDARDELKKYKKITPEERFKNIQSQLNKMYEKFIAQLDKLHQQKDKELHK